MSSNKIKAPNEKNNGFIWAIAVIVIIIAVVIGFVIINDKNNLQLAGPTREIMNTDPLADKWKAFGMTVTECQGNDMASVVATLEGLKQEGKPNVVIANTTKGAGISFIQGRPEWHHRVPKGEEIALALEELKDE